MKQQRRISARGRSIVIPAGVQIRDARGRYLRSQKRESVVTAIDFGSRTGKAPMRTYWKSNGNLVSAQF